MKHIIKASLAVVIIVFIVMFLIGVASNILGNGYSVIVSVFIAGVASGVAAIVTLVWAVPVHLVLTRYDRHKFIWYFAMAIIPSVVFVYGFKPFGDDSEKDLFMQAAVCSLIGTIAAFVFWYLAVHKLRKGV